ncbi:MAG: hypothetical protein V9E87_11215 [Gemmatimonadales bacterium]
MTENDAGPRTVSSPFALTHAEAASRSGAATVKSLMHSKKPKKPTRSWCTSLCSRLWIAAIRPTTSPPRSARKYSASAWAKNGFFARSSSFFTSARNGGTQFGSRRCSRYGKSMKAARSLAVSTRRMAGAPVR